MTQVRLFLSILCISFILSANAFAHSNFNRLPNMVEKLTPSIARIINMGYPKKEEKKEEDGNPLDRYLEKDKKEEVEKAKPKLVPRGFGTGIVIKIQKKLSKNPTVREIKENKLHILTNHHVVDDAKKIYVKFSNGDISEATVVFSNKESDLALLKLSNEKILKGREPIEFSRTSTISGMNVFAIGHPAGFEYTVTKGIISSEKRVSRFRIAIQTDAAINMGNSGGPLFNMNGRLIGVNTWIFSSSGGSMGINFALKSTYIQHVLKKYEKHGKIDWPVIGVLMKDDFINNAVVIDKVAPKSPAENGALSKGDKIIEINGKKIKNSLDILEALIYIEPGSKIPVVVKRDDMKITSYVIPNSVIEEDIKFEKP